MTISVCIATIRPTTLGAAIQSIQSQTWSDWELIVVGQGEEAPLQAATNTASAGDRRVRYLHLPQKGLSRALNAGLRAAQGDIVAMTDDDCEARPDWLATLADCFAAEPTTGLVGGALRAPEAVQLAPSCCLDLDPPEMLYDPIASGRQMPKAFEWYGANFAVRRAVAERVGPFDEYLGSGSFFGAGNDLDYKLRLEALGVPMRSTPRAVVSHTYGRRYGMRATIKYSQGQHTGIGANLGKLTLLGDARGETWLRDEIVDSLRHLARQPSPFRLASKVVRLRAMVRAYRYCVRHFQVDSDRRLLQPRSNPAVGPGIRVPAGSGRGLATGAPAAYQPRR